MTALKFLQTYLDERERLEKAATEGKWREYKREMIQDNWDLVLFLYNSSWCKSIGKVHDDHDRKFLLHARNMHAAETDALKLLIEFCADYCSEALEAAAKALGWEANGND